ncbi:putative RNA-binding protein 25 [Balamuthia mandrillaris]
MNPGYPHPPMMGHHPGGPPMPYPQPGQYPPPYMQAPPPYAPYAPMPGPYGHMAPHPHMMPMNRPMPTTPTPMPMPTPLMAGRPATAIPSPQLNIPAASARAAPHSKTPLLPTPATAMSPTATAQQTTAYVGKIAPTVEDDFLQAILEQCGTVASWKRIKDPLTDQNKSFGFCKYENPEGLLCALRVLNDFELEGSKLLIQVDDKTKKFLEEYKKRGGNGLLPTPQQPPIATSTENGTSGANTEQGDGAQKPPTEEEQDNQAREKINKMVLERKTGDFFKQIEEMKVESAEASSAMETAVEEGETIAGHEIDKHKAVLVTQEIQNFRVRQAARDKEKESKEKEGSSRPEKSVVEKEWERELREQERERARIREQRSREREQLRRRREKEEHDFKKLERQWEEREREIEKARRTRERDQEREYHRQVEKEVEFDEDYERRRKRKLNDASLAREKERRKREREREEELDEEDRRNEREEELQKQREMEEAKRRQEEEEEEGAPSTEAVPSLSLRLSDIDSRISKARRLGFELPTMAGPKISVTPGFNPDEQQDQLWTRPKKRKKLITLEPLRSEDQIRKEREEEAKQIVAEIPMEKEPLFAYAIDWATVDETSLVDKKMRPWVAKKVVEYLGEEEPTLINFILTKLSTHIAPKELLEQLNFVFEEEAEKFVFKLWRMLIFEMRRAQKEKERQPSPEED